MHSAPYGVDDVVTIGRHRADQPTPAAHAAHITTIDSFDGCTLEVRDAGTIVGLWLTTDDGRALGAILDHTQRADLAAILAGGAA